MINNENFENDHSPEDQNRMDDQAPMEALPFTPEEVVRELKSYQDLFYAAIGGLSLSLLCALVWAVITVATEYQIGYMAIGVGLGVGFGVRFFGAGIDQVFGLIGGFFALLGCVLGNLFSQIGFIANYQALGYLETFQLIDSETLWLVMEESFSPIDILFYGIAVYEGYKFAFRAIPENALEAQDLKPELSSLRLPMVIACFVIISITLFTFSQGASGEKVFYYDNGAVQASGEYAGGELDGTWTYFYENGEKQMVANYANGVEEGSWMLYSETGKLLRTGRYKNGLWEGVWLTYTENGVLVDSSNFVAGRLQGDFRAYYENGQLYQQGQYVRDRQTGEWKIYGETGVLITNGNFDNGELRGQWTYRNPDGLLSQELDYHKDGVVRVLNAWDPEGRQLVKDGNGTYISYDAKKNKITEGKVVDGVKVGQWTTYFANGKVQETAKFVADQYVIESAWNRDGEQIVEQGNGAYLSYFEDTDKTAEEGMLKGGYRDGVWLTYHPNSIIVQQENTYQDGKLTGDHLTYSASGIILTKGSVTDGKKQGEWQWFYESGQLQCTISYIDDKKQGDQIFFSEQGKEVKKEVYEDGVLVSETML